MTDDLVSLEAAHAVRHDPAHVLRQVVAHRAILTEHPIATDLSEYVRGCGSGMSWGCVNCHDRDGVTKGEGYCGTLKALASIYADRPGYRDEWRPQA